MKKILLVVMLALTSTAISAKDRKPSFFETHDPNPDSLMAGYSVKTDGGVYSIVGVDSIQKNNAKQLYKKVKEWIGSIYNEPSKVIKSESEPDQLVFEGQLYKNIHGRVIFKFKDGRYRVEISKMKMVVEPELVRYLHFSEKNIELVPKYEISRGERAGKWLLADIFEYLNALHQVTHKMEEDW